MKKSVREPRRGASFVEKQFQNGFQPRRGATVEPRLRPSGVYEFVVGIFLQRFGLYEAYSTKKISLFQKNTTLSCALSERLTTKKFLLCIFLSGGLLTGCNPNAVRDEDVAMLADLECQARQLKEQRFRVANELRLRGDSLMKANISLTEAQRSEEDSLKQTLTEQTGELATRLTFVMDSLFEAHYETIEQREEFDQALAKKVGEVCQ